jgi:glycosyltransferase involved in cell wall biosynthesis
MSTPGNKAYAKEFFISPELDNPCIYIDVSDLVEYIHHNITYSGIQRVVAQLLKYAYYNRSNRVFPVVPCNGTSNFNVYPLERLIEILSAIEEGNTTRTKLDDALDEIGNITTTVSPQPGDIYFMPGAFWTYDSHDFLMDLKTIGVSFVFFVHDLIQIVNPEYVHESANRKFLVSFVNAVSVADNIITNSNYVADDVSKFIEDRLSASLPNKVPVYAAPLATELPIIKTKSASQVSAEIRRVTATPYVLCVGTMEIRKNNLYLVKVWEKLRSSIGSEMVPNIIYVGKKGWHNDHFFDYIENCGYLDNWVYLMEKISDVDLSYLYDKCAFTAYVSFAEGYGLPISESFAHGKLCVTSNVTSMPEVGSNFAAYVNPYDVRSGIDVIGSLIKNSDLIKAA